MLGGLARWLRAAGHDAAWVYGIDDRDLVEKARREDRILLSSDAPLCWAILAEGLPSEGDGGAPPAGKAASPRSRPRPSIGGGPYPRALFVPRGLGKLEALRFVIGKLNLSLLDPRCMACGGELSELAREEARGEVPPATFRSAREFWRCGGCRKIFWEGSHWSKISARLESAIRP
jgi:hypothetical protein